MVEWHICDFCGRKIMHGLYEGSDPLTSKWFCDLWCANRIKRGQGKFAEEDPDSDYMNYDYKVCPICGRKGVSEYHMANCEAM